MRKLLLTLLTLTVMISNAPSDIAAQTRRQRAERVDLLVLGGTVVTMDEGRRILHDAGIAIKDARIVAIDTAGAIRSKYSALQTINAHGKLIVPGLINGHTHIPMTLFAASRTISICRSG